MNMRTTRAVSLMIGILGVMSLWVLCAWILGLGSNGAMEDDSRKSVFLHHSSGPERIHREIPGAAAHRRVHADWSGLERLGRIAVEADEPAGTVDIEPEFRSALVKEAFEQALTQAMQSIGVAEDYTLDCEEFPCVAFSTSQHVVDHHNEIRSQLATVYSPFSDKSVWSMANGTPPAVIFAVIPNVYDDRAPDERGAGAPARLQRIMDRMLEAAGPPLAEADPDLED